MSDWLRTWTPADVAAQKTVAQKSIAYANYMQQKLGVPYPTVKDMIVLRKKIKALFEQYPNADWKTLCKIVDYCKSVRYRPNRAWAVLDKHREAWAAGFVPEMDFNYKPPEPAIDDRITDALAAEKRPGWRRRLLMAQTPEQKKGVLEQWRASDSSYTST